MLLESYNKMELFLKETYLRNNKLIVPPSKTGYIYLVFYYFRCLLLDYKYAGQVKNIV